jgi:glycosyltransferase involved in cell wall biosynthesis
MSAPRVSIVIDNFNYARFLARAIDSALAQTQPGVEVVVVDDASTDGSRAVIARYGDRVLPVLLERNRGQGAAFNAGFAACHGEVVLFLDADDWLYPAAAASAAAAIGPGVAQVQFRLQMVDREGQAIDLLPAPEVTFDSGDVVPLLLARGRYENTVTSGNAFARAALEAILPMPEEPFRISADGYLVTVAPLEGRVVSIDAPLGTYVLHGDNGWSSVAGSGLPERFRRAIAHDELRYAALRRRAATKGLTLRRRPGHHDAQHLTSRLGSLVLEPDLHPVASDSRIGLALLGAWASRAARLPRARRAVLAAWFVALGIAPRRWAASLLSWRLVPSSRPAALRASMARLRVLLQ